MSDRYCVFGNPVTHSWSPKIHAEFARQTGEAIEYGRREVPLGAFDAAAEKFFGDGGRGLNITLPFKADAARYADQVSPRVAACGAANTLWREGLEIHADNTDGIGLVRDLERNLATPLHGRRVLVLGAGGAVRGVLPALLGAGCESVHVANRTAARAEALVAACDEPGRLTAGGLDALHTEEGFDLLINAISAGLHGEMPPLPESLIGPHAFCYDMIYGPRPTPFLQWARRVSGTRLADGLGMLVEQAAESFLIWRGKMPDTAPVIDMIRLQMQEAG